MTCDELTTVCQHKGARYRIILFDISLGSNLAVLLPQLPSVLVLSTYTPGYLVSSSSELPVRIIRLVSQFQRVSVAYLKGHSRLQQSINAQLVFIFKDNFCIILNTTAFMVLHCSLHFNTVNFLFVPPDVISETPDEQYRYHHLCFPYPEYEGIPVKMRFGQVFKYLIPWVHVNTFLIDCVMCHC